MSSDLAAIRKAERNFKREHDKLAKDGVDGLGAHYDASAFGDHVACQAEHLARMRPAEIRWCSGHP